MKRKLMFLGTAGLTALILSSFSFETKNESQQEPAKTRHIKLMKIENGKKIELDTVLMNDDVFVWNGDTLNPARLGKHQNVEFDQIRGNERVFMNKSGKSKIPMEWNQTSDGNMEIITEDLDSMGKKIVIRKRIHDDSNDDSFNLNDHRLRNFPPMPPTPPEHMRMLKQVQKARLINLNDPNIVSFKKKDLKGCLERIEIIRKKTDGQEKMIFSYRFDDQMGMPEPPEMPELDGDIQRMRIME